MLRDPLPALPGCSPMSCPSRSGAPRVDTPGSPATGDRENLKSSDGHSGKTSRNGDDLSVGMQTSEPADTNSPGSNVVCRSAPASTALEPQSAPTSRTSRGGPVLPGASPLAPTPAAEAPVCAPSSEPQADSCPRIRDPETTARRSGLSRTTIASHPTPAGSPFRPPLHRRPAPSADPFSHPVGSFLGPERSAPCITPS